MKGDRDMTKGYGRPEEAWKEARRQPGTTFSALVEILGQLRAEYGDDGMFGWSLPLCAYSNVRNADKLAYRIRHGQMVLPDADGGVDGAWSATVVQEDGVATVYVAYRGTVTDEEGND